MKKSTRLSTTIKRYYNELDMVISPLLASLLAECDRIQQIQDKLWAIANSEPLITEYTNKSGASNATANAALKELRGWELVFQGACRSVYKIVKNDLTAHDNDVDELAEFY